MIILLHADYIAESVNQYSQQIKHIEEIFLTTHRIWRKTLWTFKVFFSDHFVPKIFFIYVLTFKQINFKQN